MKCPKCGCENPDDSLYCSECGEKIELEKFLCPKCHKDVIKGSKHCNYCGAELEWVDVDYDKIPIPEKNKQNLEFVNKICAPRKKVDVRQIFSYISLGILTFGIFFILIGCLGGFCYSKTSGTGITNAGLDYIFKVQWQVLKQYSKLKYQEAYGFVFFLTIFHTLSYISLVIGLFVFGPLSIVSAARKTFNINSNKPSFVGPLLAMGLPFLAFTAIRFFTSNRYVSSYEEIGFGWGSILMIIGFIFAIISSLLPKLAAELTKNNAKNIVSKSLHFGSVLCLMFFFLFGFGATLAVRSDGYSSNYNAVYLATNLITDYSSASEATLHKAFNPLISSFIISLIAVALLIIAICLKIKKNSIASTTFAGCAMIVNILAIAFGLAGLKLLGAPSGVSIVMSFGAAVSIVFANFAIGLSIASLILQAKAKPQIN